MVSSRKATEWQEAGVLMAPLASISFGLALCFFLGTPKDQEQEQSELGEAMLPFSTASLLLASKLLFEPEGPVQKDIEELPKREGPDIPLTPPEEPVLKRRRLGDADSRGPPRARTRSGKRHPSKRNSPSFPGLAPGDPVLLCSKPVRPEVPKKGQPPSKMTGRVASILRSQLIEGADWDSGDRFGCICHTQEYRGFVVQCEECLVWQHGSCFGFSSPSDAPSAYFCDMCRPEYHTSGRFHREPQAPLRPADWDDGRMVQAAWITPQLSHFRQDVVFDIRLPNCTELYNASDPVKPFNFAPLEELMRVVELWSLATNHSFDENYKAIKQSIDSYDLFGFQRSIEEFNASTSECKVSWRRSQGYGAEVACELMVQAYSRTVSPLAFDLVASRNGSATYGELLPFFASQFMREAGLGQKKRREVFVDLGSGVGSIALQAALEFGAEGWGCEMMPTPARIAQKQLVEVQARANAWGLDMGPVHLVEGDFFLTEPILRALSRADVVLATNLLFEDSLNIKMRDMFAKLLPNGCRIVTLRPFVRTNRRGRPVTDPQGNEAMFHTEQREYPPSSVSWCYQAGPWYITDFHRDDKLDEKSLNLLLKDKPW